MKHTITERIPRCNLTHITVGQDKMFAKMIEHLIKTRTVLHHKDMNFDFIIEELRTREDLINCCTVVVLDIDVVRGEYNPTENTTPLHLLEVKNLC